LTRRGIPYGCRVDEIADDLITDLLRSAWIIERGRAAVYRTWNSGSDRFGEAEARAEQRAEVVERVLTGRVRRLDAALVDAHAKWMLSLAGTAPGEVQFGDIFLVRLADWVEGHAGPFLDGGEKELKELGELDRADISVPDSIPPPPGFEPLATPAAEPPGEVRFRFGILGDLHVGSFGGEAFGRAAVADLNASGAVFVVQLGDVTDHGDKDEFELATSVLGDLQIPCTTMMGNHDVFSYKEERLAGREYYPAAFGREPEGVLLEHDGVRIAVLDSAEHGASPFAPFNLVTGGFEEGSGGAVVRGSLTPRQHDILADVASSGADPAFVFLHHPPQPFTAFPPVIFGLRDADSGRLHATVDSGNVWGVFAGHTHRNARTRSFNGVPAMEVASPRDYPFGYALVDVTDAGYAYNFHQISDRSLLDEGYARSGPIHRRYGRGTDDERAFVWTKRR
jgi:3',5'-cyclic AMP phosphodiesterase CpdA